MSWEDLKVTVGMEVQKSTGKSRFALHLIDSKEEYCLDREYYTPPPNLNTEKAQNRWLSKRLQNFVKETGQ